MLQRKHTFLLAFVVCLVGGFHGQVQAEEFPVVQETDSVTSPNENQLSNATQLDTTLTSYSSMTTYGESDPVVVDLKGIHKQKDSSLGAYLLKNHPGDRPDEKISTTSKNKLKTKKTTKISNSKANSKKDSKNQGTGDLGLPLYNSNNYVLPREGIPIIEHDWNWQMPLEVRPITDVIVIHHVAIPSGDTSAAAINKAHQDNGWAGIGYHYVIRQDGRIERGRPLETVGAHSYGNNEHAVGICLSGNFQEETVSPAQYQSLVKLVAAVARIYNLKPSEATIKGHRDLNTDTSCPGENLYVELPQLRRDVKALMAQQDNPVPILTKHKQVKKLKKDRIRPYPKWGSNSNK